MKFFMYVNHYRPILYKLHNDVLHWLTDGKWYPSRHDNLDSLIQAAYQDGAALIKI